MNEIEKDKILETIKEVCSKKDDQYFKVLEKIYDHVSSYPNQESNSRAENVKEFISKNK